MTTHARERARHARAPRALVTFIALLWLLAPGAHAAVAGSAPSAPTPAPTPGAELRTPRVPPSAIGHSGEHAGKPRVEVRLLVHPDDRDAATQRLGVLFDLDPGWHVYWRTPGETGLPTEIDWEIPGATVGPIAWPAPSRFEVEELDSVSFGYDRQVLLSATARFESAGGARPFAAAQVDMLLCQFECVPAQVMLERSLEAPVEDAALVRALFADAAQRVPVSPASLGVELEAFYTQSAVRPGDVFAGAIGVRSCVDGDADCRSWQPAEGPAAFFPELPEALRLSSAGRSARGPHLHTLRFQGSADDFEDTLPETRLRGVLALERGDERRHIEVDLPLPTADKTAKVTLLGEHWSEAGGGPATGAGSAAPLSGAGLLQAMLLALLGGLILNGMPCVMPVLAIKVFAIAESAHRARRDLLAQGAAYTFGILASMGALAGAVVALRSAGHAVGWGFQFQEPLFVASICLVVLAFALNLFGVFEIELGTGALAGVGQEAVGARRSFFEGLLAVVLATPCSAPFLGTAVGFAFAQNAATIFAIFLCIGLGLAAPFALVTLVPAWSRIIPRSGNWMLKLRAGLGFALLATAVWLVWVFGRTAGIDATAQLLGLMVVLGFGLWLFGQIQTLHRPKLSLALLATLLLVSGFALNAVRAGVEASPPSHGARTSSTGYAAYDEAAIQGELAKGRAVFVTFTADWCITCKVNERVVLKKERVRDALEQLDVATFTADWTRRDATIRDVLQRHGKAGVPMYLVFDPRSPAAPRVLPELLTVDRLLDALRVASPAGA